MTRCVELLLHIPDSSLSVKLSIFLQRYASDKDEIKVIELHILLSDWYPILLKYSQPQEGDVNKDPWTLIHS